MMNILKKVRDKLLFMRSERKLFNQITNLNKKVKWNNDVRSNQSVMVDGIIKYFDVIAIVRMYYAEGLAEALKLPICVVDYKTNNKWRKLINSFDANILTLRQDIIANPFKYAKVFSNAVRIVFTHKSGDYLVNLKCKDVPVGELIYESILRERHILTIKKLEFKDFKYVLLGLCTYNHADKICRLNRPKYYVSFNTSYIDAIYLKTAVTYGARGILCPGAVDMEEMVDVNGNDTTYADYFIRKDVMENYKNIIDDSYIEYIKKYFERRFRGEVDVESLAAYGRKRKIDRTDFYNIYKLDKNKKIIVVFAHCFSDACRRSGILYKDFYDWIENTIRILSDNININAFIKVHPMHIDYKEYDPTKDIINKYNHNNNLYVFPDDVSTQSIFDIADCIITCFGTIGIEAPCFGIPVIVGGDAWYANSSFARYYNKIKDYEGVLKSIHKISKLNTDEINDAKKVYFSYLPIYNGKKDEFYNYITSLLKSDKSSREKTLCGLKYIISVMSKNDIRQNSYYKEAVELTLRG